MIAGVLNGVEPPGSSRDRHSSSVSVQFVPDFSLSLNVKERENRIGLGSEQERGIEECLFCEEGYLGSRRRVTM